MKKGFQVLFAISGLLLLMSCGQTRPEDAAALKQENQSLLGQMDVLNEKLIFMSEEISNLKQLQGGNASTYSNLIKDLSEQLAAKESTIRDLEKSVRVTFVGDVFFDEGSDVIKPAGLKALDNIVKTLISLKDRFIRVEGYTDDVPIAKAYQQKFPSNWELSTARADSVVRYLVGKGVKPEMIKAAGYSKYNPVASNETAEGKAKNRRIEIELVPMDTRAKFK